MFQLCLAAAGEVLGVSIRREASRVTKADWCLNAKLVLEPVQRRCSVQGLVTKGRASEFILDEMLMIAIMAKLPMASTADHFLLFSAVSLEVRTKH